MRHAATSDRRFYDRYFFTGHQCSEELFFMAGIGSYPNLGVIDAFGSVALGSRQYTTRASRELGGDRMDTTAIGPFHAEVFEGLRKLRVRCDKQQPGLRRATSDAAASRLDVACTSPINLPCPN